jgi:hypothetical protein
MLRPDLMLFQVADERLPLRMDLAFIPLRYDVEPDYVKRVVLFNE